MNLPLCVRIDAEDNRSAENLKRDGWREIEVLETWRGYRQPKFSNAVRTAGATLSPKLQKMAVEEFKLDRLHRDHKVGKSLADAAKRTWVINAFQDPNKRILVSGVPGRQLNGFLIYWMDGAELVIDLLAAKVKRQRIAEQLVRHAMHLETRCVTVRAGTQDINKAAQEFYQSLGFIVTKRQRTLHKP